MPPLLHRHPDPDRGRQHGARTLAFQLLDQHIKHRVAGAIESGNKKQMAQKTQELLEAVHRFSRTK